MQKGWDTGTGAHDDGTVRDGLAEASQDLLSSGGTGHVVSVENEVLDSIDGAV